jgi:glucokinase
MSMSTGLPSSSKFRLVGDVGGTNARFGVVTADNPMPREERVLSCDDYPDLGAAIDAYLAGLTVERPSEGAVAVATPITSDKITFTNNAWSFSLETVRQKLRFDRLLLLNDFTALAMSLPQLGSGDFVKVGRGEPVVGKPIGLIGPGTGLGVSGLIPSGKQWIPLESEGGHTTLSPANDREIEIVRVARRHFAHVSFERLVCGPGLVTLYQSIATLEGKSLEKYEPKDITERALSGACKLCVEAMEVFCAMLGTAASNLAITLGARGGVYIGGGIVPQLGDFFGQSAFRRRFEEKGRFEAYMAAIPTYVIVAKSPALRGAAVSLIN